ncbi:MAG: Ig domain-containing protein [Eubacteriaceae bacterium]|nr:Ig domain-containing protein [Eubacteriaceae bacterium]
MNIKRISFCIFTLLLLLTMPALVMAQETGTVPGTQTPNSGEANPQSAPPTAEMLPVSPDTQAPPAQNSAADSALPSVIYEVHGRDYGWEQGEKRNGAEAGTTGQSLRLEALRVSVKDASGNDIEGLDVTYRVHIKDIGWGSWTDGGLQAGTVGKSTRIEAAEIKLTGEKAEAYDITYRVHMKDTAWGGWVKNGETAGTTGESRRIEAIEIKIVPKGSEIPME